MLPRRRGRRLIELAFQLIAIADLRDPPRSRRGAEPGFERPGKRLGGTKADGESNLQDREARLRDQSQGRRFQSSPAHVVAERLAEPRCEQAVKVKRREIADLGERVELQLFIQPPVYVLEHAVHADDVFRTAITNQRDPGDSPAASSCRCSATSHVQNSTTWPPGSVT